MLVRIGTIMLNTYREAVRARVLHGLFALALVTAGYCVAVGQFASASAARVLSNLGSASVALYGVFVAIVLSATALHREIELKTLFPILARPIARWEYVLGRYLGTVFTLAVFVAGNAAVFLCALAATVGPSVANPVLAALGCVALVAMVAWRVPASRNLAPALGAALLVAVGAWFCRDSPDDRRVLLVSAWLTVLEVGVVAAIALLFSAFSSPFLTAVFTLGVFIVGRSADTLANLPARLFGEVVHDGAAAIAKVVPNLMTYVPARALLTGEGSGVESGRYVAWAGLQALGWMALLLALASAIFRRRDLT
jgi:Cu-processing system permease protein